MEDYPVRRSSGLNRPFADTPTRLSWAPLRSIPGSKAALWRGGAGVILDFCPEGAQELSIGRSPRKGQKGDQALKVR